ncbi:putative membrane protein [Leptospira inadai serovar Lyme str. 10]|uniref:Putative membrane protein n=1 Tax=Leptospira inadai serovar Lyme str. 10 TaxID=1049790 RepID=V6HEU2_9LEPT|nr:putative membrane protein [Leptospira inadai serovar Lyme str. 10]
MHGNSVCSISPTGLHQSGDSYFILEQNFAGCFSKGVEKKFHFTIANATEQENHLEIYENLKKLGDWPIKKGISNIDLISDRSTINLSFKLKIPPQAQNHLFLFQKKTIEFKTFYRLTIVLLVISLLILILKFPLLIKSKLKYYTLMWILSFSIYFMLFSHSPISLIGDEPHYLIVAESIIENHDLSMKNQYDTTKPSLLFRDFDHHTLSINGVERPAHYPFLALYLAPAFLNQNGRIHADPVLAGKCLMILISTTLSAFLLFTFINRPITPIKYLFTPLIVFGMPILAYSNQIYPEVMISFFLYISYFLLTKSRYSKLWNYLPIIFIIFPFIHIKFLAISCILVVYWAWKLRKKGKLIYSGLAIYSLGILLFFYYNYFIYGKISPYTERDIFLENIIKRYLGYLFDVDRGLFALNPLLFFAFIQLTILFRRNKIEFLLTLSLIVFGHIPNLLHSIFWLGSCPFGRYWIAIYPLMSFLSLLGIRDTIRFFQNSPDVLVKYLKISVFAISSMLLLITTLQIIGYISSPENYYTHFEKNMVMPTFIEKYTPLNIRFLFYSYFIESTLFHVIFWFVILIFFIFLGIRISTHKREPTRNGKI